jgi:hypothetical protein
MEKGVLFRRDSKMDLPRKMTRGKFKETGEYGIKLR